MYAERVIVSASDIKQRAELLASRGLSVPGGESVIIGLFDDERLVATGSLVGNILEGFAVREELEGQGLTSELLSVLLQYAADSDIWRLFLFTKPKEASRFADLGFSLVAKTEGSALLEWGSPKIENFLDGITRRARSKDASCVVVNCNPFTLGHQYLIKTAASALKEDESLYIIVIEDPAGQNAKRGFPFDVRFRLVKEGVTECLGEKLMDKVVILSGGEYVISAATFPSYFTRVEEFASVHAALDLEIFARRIAPALSITKRFVGSEPFSAVTNIYNETMKRVLPGYGVSVEELERLEVSGMPVSASRVRALLAEGKIELARELVPPTTWRYIASLGG
ncbi:citrate (pro-3S)-lyase] ligase [Synergistales bacterium]|nr:citrate (pro-3S)-lyase] ligase [Synergistales bacterium]